MVSPLDWRHPHLLCHQRWPRLGGGGGAEGLQIEAQIHRAYLHGNFSAS